MKIDLERFRHGTGSLSFIGQKQGQDARTILNLDTFDTNEDVCTFTIPPDTVSFNPSFYLGLLRKSLEVLGEEAFKKKYLFEIQRKIVIVVIPQDKKEEDKETKRYDTVSKNLVDGFRNMQNMIALKGPLWLLN
ncbi:MAG TPA: hypothetical protein VL576_03205 [Candidatus Paceibacterota bacterium]|jgi:hypothetical protein|nr:hypothetical protein [Candidatus Paceibacterota bacterium]